jgi:hypothetical protein
VSTPSVSPAAGHVKERITRERILSASEANKDNAPMPDFWDYVESLTSEQWNDHIVYLYREDPKASTYSGEFAYLDKFVGYIEVRPGVQVPMEERGLIEQAIKEKFGGRAFRLICKRGKQRVTVGKCVNEAPPKYPDTNSQQFAGPLPNAGSDANAIASKAIDTVANHPQEALRIAQESLRTTAEIISRLGHQVGAPAAPATSTESDLDRAFKAAMIQRMTQDPIDGFLRMRELFTPPQNTMVEKIVTVAMERFMNPPASVSGRTTLLDLGREALPVLAQTVDRAMTNWRMGVEAQRDAIAMQRGVNPGAPITTAPVAAAPTTPLPPPNENPPAAAAPGNPGNGMQQPPAGSDPPFEWIEMKIVEIYRALEKGEYSIDSAVDHLLDFLYRASPNLVPLLLDPPKIDARLSAGEQGLLQLFQHRPVLQQIPVGPRLTEFISRFAALAKEAELERTAGVGKTPSAPATPPAGA